MYRWILQKLLTSQQKTPPHLLLLLALHLHYNICSLSSCNSVQIKQKKTNKPSGEGLSLNGKKETLGS